MTEAERALIRASAAVASADTPRLGAALDAAAAVASALEIEEVLLQSYLFLGYPAALRAFRVWRDGSRVSAAPPRSEDPGSWRERGEAVCARVYGGQYERLRENMARLHGDLAEWMLVEGYGKVLGRTGLPLRARELCIIALLVAQDAAPQLYSHLRGALNVGVSPEDVETAIAIAAEELGTERAAAAMLVWRGLAARRDGGGVTGTATREPAGE